TKVCPAGVPPSVVTVSSAPPSSGLPAIDAASVATTTSLRAAGFPAGAETNSFVPRSGCSAAAASEGSIARASTTRPSMRRRCYPVLQGPVKETSRAVFVASATRGTFVLPPDQGDPAMPKYADGFVLPIPKKNIDAYRKIARKAGKLWKEYGAL